jgi:phthiodiolone/phenolphthiodiolone dimycocerosates ketoreductase
VMSTKTKSRVRVGCYVDPITPLWSLRANIALARLTGAEDVWFGDHAKSMFPSSAWGPHLSPFARFIPTLDAFLDPTVTIAKYARRGGPRMGTSVTDAVRRTPADLAECGCRCITSQGVVRCWASGRVRLRTRSRSGWH